MAETDGDRWARWLQDQFERRHWRPTDLVQAAQALPGDRAPIRADRVTDWLKGQRPSYKLALVAADAFGTPRADALRAAGYPPVGEEKSQGTGESRGIPVGANVDPELLADLAESDPATVQRVKDFLRGIKAGRE